MATEAQTTPEPSDQPRAPSQRFVLKQGDTFLVADPTGDIAGGDDGLFHNDTRILSLFRLKLAGRAPWVLGAAVSRDNVFFTATLTNFPLPRWAAPPPRKASSISSASVCSGRIASTSVLHFKNFSTAPAKIPVSITVGADYRDMFEVRGQQRRAHGTRYAPTTAPESITLQYEGLDSVCRTSVIAFSETPAELNGAGAGFLVDIPQAGNVELYVEVGLDAAPRPGAARSAPPPRWR